MNAYFELTGLTGHEVGNSAELLPGRQTLLCPVLLQRARTVLPKPAAVAKPTVAMAPPRVEARRPHRLLPLIVARIDGRHVEESGDGVELFPHLNCSSNEIGHDGKTVLTVSNIARWRRSCEGNTFLLAGSLEVEHRVSGSESFWDVYWLALRSVLVNPQAAPLFHLGGEGDVMVQKLAILGEGEEI